MNIHPPQVIHGRRLPQARIFNVQTPDLRLRLPARHLRLLVPLLHGFQERVLYLEHRDAAPARRSGGVPALNLVVGRLTEPTSGRGLALVPHPPFSRGLARKVSTSRACCAKSSALCAAGARSRLCAVCSVVAGSSARCRVSLTLAVSARA